MHLVLLLVLQVVAVEVVLESVFRRGRGGDHLQHEWCRYLDR